MERESHLQQEAMGQSPESRLRREMAASLVRQLDLPSFRYDLHTTQSEILQKLHALGPEAVEALLFVLRDPKWARKRRWRDSLAAMTFFLFSTAAMLHKNSLLFSLFLGCALTALAACAAWKSAPLELKAARALAEFDDLRCVGPLVTALDLPEGSVRRAAREALARLLPRLQASDAGLLSLSEKECLYRALGSQDIDLILAILEALKHIGGHRAIPYVVPLIQGEQQSIDPRVRRAAQECLRVLYLYQEQEQAAGTLLRASERPSPNSDALLRPVSSASSSASRELLRPHE